MPGSHAFSFDDEISPLVTRNPRLSCFSFFFFFSGSPLSFKAPSLHPLLMLQKQFAYLCPFLSLLSRSHRLYNSTIHQLLHQPPHPTAFLGFSNTTNSMSLPLFAFHSEPTISQSSLTPQNYLLFEYISLPICIPCFFSKNTIHHGKTIHQLSWHRLYPHL